MKFLNEIDGASKLKQDSSNRLVTDVEKAGWNSKAEGNHNHSKNEITDFPTSLPASGGNADTVDGKHASDFANIEGVSGSWRTGEIIHNVARCLYQGTPTEILIKTGIPFISSAHMPVIHLQGYAYGQQAPIELKIGYYVYSGKHGWCGAVSLGAWRPTIKLFSYIGADSKKYTGIALIGSIYFPQFSVSVQTEFGGNYPNGWSITSNMADNTVYHMPDTDVVTVPYKSTFSQKINGVTFNGTSDITITANPNPHTHDERYYTKTQTDTHLNDKVDNSRVLTDVPINAKFTDTTYSEITTAEIDAGTASTLRTITARRIKYILDKVSSMVSTVISSLTKNDVGLGNVDNIQQATKSEFNSHNADNARHIISSERTKWNTVDNKVDKVTGKGLSTNDYTAAEKTKLSGVESGANKTTINNTLTSTSTTEALSANQGRTLKGILDKDKAEVDTKISNLDSKMVEVDTKINSKLDTSVLTFTEGGKTYLAKFAVENGIPVIIANEVI